MKVFAIKNTTKRNVQPIFDEAQELLKPFLKEIPSAAYPIKVVVVDKADSKDELSNWESGIMTLKVWESESEQSNEDIVWSVLHEFGHALQDYNKEINASSHAIEQDALDTFLQTKFGLSSHEVEHIFHDFLPGEVFPNAFATLLLGKFYKRHDPELGIKLLSGKLTEKKMKRDKKLLRELTGVALPIIRKQLEPMVQTEEVGGIPFDKLQPGQVIMFPKKPGRKYIIVTVAKFGGYIHYIEYKGDLEMASKNELKGARVAEMGGSSKPIDV